jgi:hypothetical protein
MDKTRRTTRIRLSILFSLALGAILAARAASAGAAAAEAQAPLPAFLVPEPGFAELGALPEPLSVADLTREALLASGLAPERMQPYEARLASLVEGARAEADRAGGAPAARGEAILGYLHGSAFKRYREDATTLDGLLDTGYYNCVSSAALYLLVAGALGLEVGGVKTRDHAFCTLRAGERSIDVETTNPYGFDPGAKKEFTDSFGKATGYAYVPPGNYSDRRAIGPRELLALILSNRVTRAESAGRYADAARLGADYDALLRGPASRKFLVDRVNNLVASLEARRDFAGAEAAAGAAAAAYPGEAALAELAGKAVYNRAVGLMQSGDYAAAFDYAARAAAESGPRDAKAAKELRDLAASALGSLAEGLARKGDFAGARRAIAAREGAAPSGAAASAYAAVGDAELVRAANGLPFAEAAATADRLLAAGELSRSRYGEAVAAIYGNEAARLGSSGDWLGAAALAEAGAAKLPGDPRLPRIADAMRRNFAAASHNEFARLYNAGKYAEAEAAVRAALERAPGSAELRGDLAAARAALRESASEVKK